MPQKILICDDSAIARKQIFHALPKDWDIDVTFAEHSQDALEKIRAGAGIRISRGREQALPARLSAGNGQCRHGSSR